MPVKKILVLQPAYYEKFSCTAGACGEVCCRDWDIAIDKNTYDRYRGIKDPEFKALFSEGVKRVRGEKASKSNYAKIVLDEKGFCKFLREDSLCGIHAKFGEKYLGAVCKLYPRGSTMMQKGVRELSMVPSCPEVARVALFNPEPMIFKMEEIPFYNTVSPLLFCKTPKFTEDKSMCFEAHAFEIRKYCISILQCRNMRLPGRLLAIGMMLSKLSGLDPEKAVEEVPAVLNFYMNAAQGGEFEKILANTEFKKEVTVEMESLLYSMALKSFNSRRAGKAYQKFADIIQSFLSEKGEMTYRDFYDKLDGLAAKHWEPFLDEKGYILENYFVNMVFSTLFPFAYSDILDIYQHFIILAEQYALLRLLLCACAEKGDGITDEMIIAVLTGIAHTTGHNHDAKNVASSYIKRGLDSLAHMSFLLK